MQEHSIASRRDLFKVVLGVHVAGRVKAAVVIRMPSHPSGVPSPSANYVEIATRLVQADDRVGVRVAYQVSVGQGVLCSLAEQGLLS